MDRKLFFKSGLKELAGELLRSPLGNMLDRRLHSLSNLLAPEWLHRSLEEEALKQKKREAREAAGVPQSDKIKQEIPSGDLYSRPPGALSDSELFLQACTRCNDCIIACPHGTIFHLGPSSGPVLDPNLYACHLCEEYPCIASCETGALLPLPEGHLPKFGQAIRIEGNCLNEPQHRKKITQKKSRAPYCRDCLKVCPVDKAIRLNREMLPVFEEHCTGCGLCVGACPTDPRALRIL